MKKCITVLMALFCLFNGFSNEKNEKSEKTTIINYSGTDSFYGAFWSGPYEHNWIANLYVQEGFELGYFVSDNKTVYVKKGATVSLLRKVDDHLESDSMKMRVLEDDKELTYFAYPYWLGDFSDLSDTIKENYYTIDIGSVKIALPKITIDKQKTIKYDLWGPKSDQWWNQLTINLIPDDDYPEINVFGERSNFDSTTDYYNYEVNYLIIDKTSGIHSCLNLTNETLNISLPQFGLIPSVDYSIPISKYEDFSTKGKLLGDNTYKLTVEDLVGHKIERTIVVDKTPPEIKAYTDADKKEEYTGSDWINKDLYIFYEDGCSGISSKVGEDFYNTSGSRDLSAIDKAGNPSTRTIKIDKDLPSFKTSLEYDSAYDSSLENFKSLFTLNISEIADEHSGIAGISVNTFVDGISKGTESVTISENEIGNNRISDKTYTFELTDRNKDNNVRFEVNVTDAAGNTETVPLGGDKGYFVPAGVSVKYSEGKNNSVRLDFFSGNKPYVNKNYSRIRVKRNFALPDKNSKDKGTDISKGNFDKSHITILKKLEEPVEVSKSNLKTDEKGVYYIDEGIRDTGFTHKFVTYDWISEYENPVDSGKKVTETIKGSEVLKLDNNTGIYYLKVKGDEGSYIILGDDGKIKEGSESAFKMPVTGVVGLEIKIEDEDTEPYRVEIQGKAEIPSENGKFKLRETDRDPVAAEGAIAGCCGTICDDGNRKTFISTSEKRPMNGDWVDMGSFNLQYNVTTVFSVELTEGFAGWQKTSKSENIRMYAKAPSVLGGKASLHVGDAGAYDADGISARPHQNFMLEIVMEDAGLNSEKFEWDFGNGLNQNNCSGKKDEKGLEIYKKISPLRFENVHYHQKEDRRGAISEYTLTIKCGEERAEFNVNIIDTQWGELLGDEVWRGDHIIKKEIIVPANTTLQIGDTVPKHSDYDSDITCLCVGKINPEDKGGITVEQGGTLKIDEGSAKHIKFIQGVLGTYSYEPATVKSFENRWKGIKVKGKLEGDRLDVADAEKALVIQGEGFAAFTRAIELNDCLEGILMNGAELKAEEIDISGSESSVSGIKTNKKIDCKTIKITGAGRGIILLSGGEFDIKTLEISGCKTGIHLLGGNLKIESGVISGCSEYGIKKEKGGSFDYGAFSFEGNERNIYENGIIR